MTRLVLSLFLVIPSCLFAQNNLEHNLYISGAVGSAHETASSNGYDYGVSNILKISYDFIFSRLSLGIEGSVTKVVINDTEKKINFGNLKGQALSARISYFLVMKDKFKWSVYSALGRGDFLFPAESRPAEPNGTIRDRNFPEKQELLLGLEVGSEARYYVGKSGFILVRVSNQFYDNFFSPSVNILALSIGLGFHF